MSSPQPVPTPSAPPVAGPYSAAVRAGDWLVLAGQVPIDPATGGALGVGTGCGEVISPALPLGAAPAPAQQT